MADLDLLVVGAGPAGVAAACTAVGRGLHVAVLDRARFPRDKVCGDGLTAGALRLLEGLGVDVPTVASTTPVDTVVLRGPDGRRVVLPLPSDGLRSVVTRRRELDSALVDRARAVGVTIDEERLVTSVRTDADHVAVEHTDPDGGDPRRVTARFVVAADGHWSTVRRCVDPSGGNALGSWHAFRQYFRGVDERRLWVLFEEDLLPGYAWVFPLPDGRANVGFGVLRDPATTGKALAATWRDLTERPSLRSVLGPDAEPDDRHRAWPIPADYDPRRTTTGRVLFVGDAAGVVDPMTGEGVAQALETGILAATAVADGGPVAAVTARYRTGVDRALGRDLRFAARLQQVLRAPLGVRGALRCVDTSDWTRRNFARWMFEDYPRALLFTPDRWRRGGFRPPGAFRVPTPT